MVVKHTVSFHQIEPWFESSVISYGSQTIQISFSTLPAFESSVISYGSQTTF